MSSEVELRALMKANVEDTVLETIVNNELDKRINTGFVCFDCLGEPNVKYNEINPKSFFQCGETSIFEEGPILAQDCGKCEQICLFGLKWDKGSVLLKNFTPLFKMASKEIMSVNSAAKLNTNVLGLNLNRSYSTQNSYFLSRKYCVELIIFIRNYVDSVCSNPNYYWILSEFIPELTKKLSSFRRQLGKLTDLPDYVYLHGCHSSGNKSIQPAYHLMHMHLDLRWLYLSVIFKLNKAKSNVENESESQLYQPSTLNDISSEISILISELVELSAKRFEKIANQELYRKSPFSCTCIQEMWIMLEIVADTLNAKGYEKKFWDYYNECVDNLSTDYNFNPSSKSIFSLWLLSSVAKLYKFQNRDVVSNYSVLETIVKTIVNEEMCESEMRTCLIFVEFICVNSWEPKVEPLIALWDYYHKKLNSNFYILGAPPISTAVMRKTSSGLVAQIKSYIEHRNSVSDSFQHFLRLIGLHLKRSKDSPRHWNVIKGRIFSKLSPPKLCSLNQAGEYHLVSLFLILAVSNGVVQVENKMIEIFNVISNSKGLVSNDLLKGLFSFVLLNIENGDNSGKLIQPLVDYVNCLSPLDNYDTMRLFAEEMEIILKANTSLNLGQHLFIGEWLSRYLFTSSQSDSGRLLETLMNILNRLKFNMSQGNPEQEVIMFVEKLWSELISYLRGVSSQSQAPFQVALLGASLASISLTSGKLERFKELFDLFLSNDVSDIRVVRKFLSCLIESSTAVNVLGNYNSTFVKAWIRCCLTCSDAKHKEMRDLTRYVSQIPEIKNICTDLADCEEPLLYFFSHLQDKYATSNIYERQALREKMSAYFEGIDKCVKPIISSPKDFDQVNSVYQSIGNMIRMISPLLYVKSKPNTVLQQLLDLTLLPVVVRNPDTKLPHNILQCVKSSLHLFIQGLFKLAPDQDHYIARMIKELVTVYVPRCVAHQNTLNFSQFYLVSEFESFDEPGRLFILETVCLNFLKKKSRNPHNQALSGLKFIKEIFTTNVNCHDIVQNVLKSTFNCVCDVFMFCDEKHVVHSSAKDILKIFLNSSAIRGTNLMDNIVCLLTSLANENLAWSSRQLFELLIFLSSEAPDLTLRFLPHLLEIIKGVEKKRGVGYDKTLRLGFEKIETRIRAIKSEDT